MTFEESVFFSTVENGLLGSDRVGCQYGVAPSPEASLFVCYREGAPGCSRASETSLATLQELSVVSFSPVGDS